MKAGRDRAFANGWLGAETFGRVTFVAVTEIEETEVEAIVQNLCQHFVEIYGAPSLDAARNVAIEEVRFMQELCEDHAVNTLLTVQRELSEAGVREHFRTIEPQEADLLQLAVHVTPE